MRFLPPWLQGIVAIGLMAGFYVLALGISGTLLWLVYWDITTSERVSGRLILFAVGAAGIILWSLVPRYEKFEPPGPELTEPDQPQLFQVLRQTAGATGEAMPVEVYALTQMNAWVGERGGFMGIGQRRIMGIGLPLLQALDVQQFRAVIAHEFGHYYGGETRVGPWLYHTRSAMRRTLEKLEEADSWLMYLFRWYGAAFVRVTQSISRNQEFAADAVAARITSPEIMADALRRLHIEGAFFGSYVSDELEPVIGGGFRPPIAEGFRRYVAAEAVQAALPMAREHALSSQPADPADSHPPLAERIAALKVSAEPSAADSGPPAISLLQKVDEVESALLRHAVADGSPLRPIRWEDVGEKVYVPLWMAAAQEIAPFLKDVTVVALPSLLSRLDEIAMTLRPGKGFLPDIEQRRARAGWTITAAFGAALVRSGWKLQATPGYCVLERDEIQIWPFREIGRLASGELSAEQFSSICTEAGLAELPLLAAAAAQA